ncbi:hypothetical protein [Phormidesmis priestleyi]
MTLTNLDAIATEEFVARLLEREGFVSTNLLKVGRSDSFLVVVEKQLVGFLNALADILYCLRTDRLPEQITFPQFGNVSLKFGTVQMLVPHPVVAFVQRNTLVIDDSSSID